MTMQNETDFGQYLQDCRRAKDISLETVSRFTRISVSCLQQIESEDWPSLPASPYVKGFIKNFAQAVGADPQEALRRYENGLTRLSESRQADRPRSAGPVWLRLLLALVVLAGVVALTLFASRIINTTRTATPRSQEKIEPQPRAQDQASESQRDVPAAVPESQPISATGRESTAKAALPENPAAGAEGPGAGDAAKAEKSPQMMKLEMSATEPVWIKVISDGQNSRELMLKAGQRVTLEAVERYSLLIGNAGGIHLSLNGREIRVPGKSGQVVTLQLP